MANENIVIPSANPTPLAGAAGTSVHPNDNEASKALTGSLGAFVMSARNPKGEMVYCLTTHPSALSAPLEANALDTPNPR